MYGKLNGYSAIIYEECSNKGKLIEKFFNNYNKIKHEDGINVGLEIIDKLFSEYEIIKLCSKSNIEQF